MMKSTDMNVLYVVQPRQRMTLISVAIGYA